MNYNDANASLGKRQRRKLANNTYMRREGDDIVVRLHDTDILTFHPNGKVVYNTGGWLTITTKDRLNNVGPADVRIWSDRGVWHAKAGDTDVVYADGLTWDGKRFKGGGTARTAEKVRREKLDIKRYAAAFLDALEAGKVQAPTGGDCWFCLLKTADGKTMGELSGDHSSPENHIRVHLQDDYFVPSLLVNALERQGASKTMMWWLGSFWDTEATQDQRDVARRQNERGRVETALRRYCMKQLGHAT